MNEEAIQKFLQADNSKPAREIREEIVKDSSGKEKLVLRDSRGMFAKKAPVTRVEAQEAIVAKVTETDAQGSSVLERILDNQIAAATTPAVQPVFDKEGNVIAEAVCPKTMMASAKAAQVVLKAAGLEQAKEEEKQHLIKIVDVSMPPETMKLILERQGGIIKECGPYQPPKRPSFAEVTDIYTNEPIKK